MAQPRAYIGDVMEVFLDNASTTPLLPAVKKTIVSVLDLYGNPSSLHRKGFAVKQLIQRARENVIKSIGANPDEDKERLLFVPSGSAANTIAINSVWKINVPKTIFYSPIAHKSILTQIQNLRRKDDCFKPLKVDRTGTIDLTDFENKISESRSANKIPYVVIDYANSEIGTVQPVEKLVEITHKYKGVIYFDCTGAISTISINVARLKADAIGFSGHKIGALKGVGVFWYNKSSVEPYPLIFGAQEHGIVGGTENVIGAVSLGAAIENWTRETDVEHKRDYLFGQIRNEIPGTYMVGATKNRLTNNINMCFKGVNGSQLATILDSFGIYVSTGSACNSGTNVPSKVLQEIGIPNEDINSCIRMTLDGNETYEQLDYAAKCIRVCVEELRSATDDE